MGKVVINAGIVGGTGYTGVELLRLLATHPEVEVTMITSRTESNTAVADLFPSLRGLYTLNFCEPEVEALAGLDVVFFATPHGVAVDMVPELMARGTKVVDLSADFRLTDIALWESWYGREHSAPALVDEAVYGLPEMNREAITGAQLVAVPGCYPTSVQLGFLPLLEAGLIEPGSLIANAASGVSGAGRQAKIDNLVTEAGDSFKAYGVSGHRHLPEIEQGLARMTEESVGLTFVPHLVPMSRGIHATLYGQLRSGGGQELQQVFEQRYQNEPFVDVMPQGSCPQTRSVRGANTCRLAVYQPQDRDVVVVLSVIDNLVKGASGQAIQCMNLMCNIDELAGLAMPPLSP